jgi:hypothetical protein
MGVGIWQKVLGFGKKFAVKREIHQKNYLGGVFGGRN